MAIDLDVLRAELRKLDWGDDGLTRDGIRLRWQGMPEELYMHLPSEKRFLGAEDVVLFAEHALAWATQPEPFDEAEVAGEGGPGAWGDSPTGSTLRSPEMDVGVGSGSDPGYTGGGSVQTGVGREGTTYGNRSESPEPDGEPG